MEADEDLRRLANLAGVETRYWDIRGNLHEASPETLRAILGALDISAESESAVKASIAALSDAEWSGMLPTSVVVSAGQPASIEVRIPAGDAEASLEWRLQMEDGSSHSGNDRLGVLADLGARSVHARDILRKRLVLPALPLGYHTLHLVLKTASSKARIIAVPSGCHLPPALEQGERLWGVSAQLYALRSERNWGVGDFTDLRDLINWAGKCKADVIGINPLHALFLHDPASASPYAPNSRLFLNPLYIDPAKLEGFDPLAISARDVKAGVSEKQENLIDYRDTAKRKLEIMQKRFEEFQTLRPDHEASALFRSFRESGGESVYRFAVFQTLTEHLKTNNWAKWPAGLRDPASGETKEFARANEHRIAFFEYLQWQADKQLKSAAAAAWHQGMAIGLYRDLAVGSDPSGADVWSDQSLYALRARIGAPPDPFSERGQEWGVVPIDPRQLTETGYACFAALLRANMRHAGALRIDHAMGLQRQFWVPLGEPPSKGTYVRYPFEDLLGILALESHRNRCVVIGEDLGTVPEGFRAHMEKVKALSYRVLYFEKQGETFRRPGEYPALSTACVATHDLPTLRGYWNGDDLKICRQLGEFASADAFHQAKFERQCEKLRLVEALSAEGLLFAGSVDEVANSPWTPALAVAVHGFVARSSAAIVVAQLEDLVGEEHQANVPGTTQEYPNWRRRLSQGFEQISSNPMTLRIVETIIGERAPLTPSMT